MSDQQSYRFRYRREQSGEFTIKASSLEEAEERAEEHIDTLASGVFGGRYGLWDDGCNDPGELTCIEVPPHPLEQLADCASNNEK